LHFSFLPSSCSLPGFADSEFLLSCGSSSARRNTFDFLENPALFFRHVCFSFASPLFVCSTLFSLPLRFHLLHFLGNQCLSQCAPWFQIGIHFCFLPSCARNSPSLEIGDFVADRPCLRIDWSVHEFRRLKRRTDINPFSFVSLFPYKVT